MLVKIVKIMDESPMLNQASVGDFIVEINGEEVVSEQHFSEKLSSLSESEEQITLKIFSMEEERLVDYAHEQGRLGISTVNTMDGRVESLAREMMASDREMKAKENLDVMLTASLDVILTTSMFVENRKIENEVDVIVEECAYGMNIFRDMFASIRDVVGGRSKAVEQVLKDGRKEALAGLRLQAARLGADAVIAVDLDYQELSGGGKNGILLVVASGTAVNLAPVIG